MIRAKGLASRNFSGWCAELHWLVFDFFAASAEGNCSNDSKYECALHNFSPVVCSKKEGRSRNLASNVLSSWCTEFHRLMLNFFAASAERNSRDDR
jgi:hypothetical protein